jgi:hypothetical protein
MAATKDRRGTFYPVFASPFYYYLIEPFNVLESMKILTLSAVLGFVVLVTLAAAANQAYAVRFGEVSGAQVGTQNGTMTKTITMKDDKSLYLILKAAGGNFGSKYLGVFVAQSETPTTFLLIDNISLSTNTQIGKTYDATHLGTLVAVNPAVYPIVKVATNAGNTGVTSTLSYLALR